MKKGLKKFNKNGQGCDEQCNLLHPVKMCRKSLRNGKCEKPVCHYMHVNGTRPNPSKPTPRSPPLPPTNPPNKTSIPPSSQTPIQNATTYANVVAQGSPQDALFLEVRSLGQIMVSLLARMDGIMKVP